MSEGTNIPLSELTAKRSGSIDPSKHPNEIFDLYSIPAFERSQPEVLKGSEIGSTKQVVKSGDVLLSKIVPHIRRAWVVGEDRGRRIIASSEWIVFRSQQSDSTYLRHVLVGDPFHAEFMRTVSGVGGSLLRARPEYVAKIEIPLPPVAEQKRIAAILDKAEELRGLRRRALSQLDSLAQSIFFEMFGDPITNPKRWTVLLLADLVSEFRYGSSNKSQPYGKPALRIPNVIGGSLNLSDLKLVPVDDSEFQRLQMQNGDILFVRTNGNPNFVGRCVVFDYRLVANTGFAEDEFIFASYLIRARLSLESIVPLFLQEFLLGTSGRRELRSRCKTSAGQFNINIPSLSTIPIPIPPLALQQEFAQRVEAIEQLKTTHRKSLTQLDALFASLQHRAFRGEL